MDDIAREDWDEIEEPMIAIVALLIVCVDAWLRKGILVRKVR